MTNPISGLDKIFVNSDSGAAKPITSDAVDTSLFDEQITAAQSGREQAQSASISISEELDSQKQTQDAIETSMLGLKDTINEISASVSTLETQAGELSASISSYQGQLDSVALVQIGTNEDGTPIYNTEEYEAQRQAIQQQIDQLNQELKNVEDLKNQALQLQEETQAQYDELQEEISQGETDIETLTYDLEQAQTEVQEKQTELDSLVEEKQAYIEEQQQAMQEQQAEENKQTEEDTETPSIEAASESEEDETDSKGEETENIETENSTATTETENGEVENQEVESQSQSQSEGEIDAAADEAKEIIETVETSDVFDLANDMNVLLYRENHSEEEIDAAMQNIEKIAQASVSDGDETAQKYQQLAIMMSQNSTEVSSQMNDLETEMTEAAQSESADENQVKDIKERENAIIKQYQNLVMDVVSDACIKNGAAKEPLEAVKFAINEIGSYKETEGDNIGECLNYGGNEGEAWCMYFINTAYGDLFKSEDFTKYAPYSYNNAEHMQAAAEGNGIYAYNNGEYSPVAGDVFNIGDAHVGMFLTEDENYYYAVEGNADDEVKFRKYAKPGTEEYINGDKRYDDITGFAKMNEYFGGTSDPAFVNVYPLSRFELATKTGSTV